MSLREQQNWSNANKYFNAAKKGFRSIKNREWEMRVEIEALKNAIQSSNNDLAISTVRNLKKLNKGNERFSIKVDYLNTLQEYESHFLKYK